MRWESACPYLGSECPTTTQTLRALQYARNVAKDTQQTPLTRPLHLGFNYVLTVFKNFREEIEAAKTLLFGLSAGAGVSALSGSSFQSIPSASLKMTSAQSSQPPVIPNTSRLNSKRAGSESDSDSEDDDLGFGESDYFHDNKYGKKLSS